MKRPKPRRLGGPVANSSEAVACDSSDRKYCWAKTGGSMSGPNWNLAGGTFASSADTRPSLPRKARSPNPATIPARQGRPHGP